jgi:hypothetical protein
MLRCKRGGLSPDGGERAPAGRTRRGRRGEGGAPGRTRPKVVGREGWGGAGNRARGLINPPLKGCTRGGGQEQFRGQRQPVVPSKAWGEGGAGCARAAGSSQRGRRPRISALGQVICLCAAPANSSGGSARADAGERLEGPAAGRWCRSRLAPATQHRRPRRGGANRTRAQKTRCGLRAVPRCRARFRRGRALGRAARGQSPPRKKKQREVFS